MRERDTVDDASLDVVFATHRQTFIRIAEKIIGCRSQAEDIVHDAFIRTLEANRQKTIGSRAGYITRIVKNLAIDRYRRKSVETRFLDDRGRHPALAAEPAQPENINIHRQTLQAVAAALAELPDRTRWAFEMHRIRGLSQKEIARILGVSPTLVNFMIRDALVHCRNKLKAESEQR